MAEKVTLYIPESTQSESVLIAGSVQIGETINYTDARTVIRDAIENATNGGTAVLAVSTEQFADVKLLLLKNLSVRILRSSKISAVLGDRLPEKSKEYNIHTAIPEGGEAFVSADGLYSALSCKAGSGFVVLLPLEQERLAQALEAGAVSCAVPAKSSKAMLADCIEKVIASGCRIAVADFGKSVALMAVVNSVNPSQDTFVPVTALTDVKYGAKDFEANLAKAAKETGEYDFGVVVSEISSDGVTICVSDSETARVEKLAAQPGEDAKKLLASAVIRLCEMTEEAADEGNVSAPMAGISNISKKSFIIVISCLIVAIVACLALCIALFATGNEVTDDIAQGSNYSNDMAELGEVEPSLEGDITLTTIVTELESTILDAFDDYTTYIGGDAQGNGAQAVYTTQAGNLAFDLGLTTEPVTDENGNTVPQEIKGKFVFTVYGWGHGAGMSQDGAIAFAREGRSANWILTYYYPNTVIKVDPNTPMYVDEPDENGEGGFTLLAFLCKTVKQEIGDGAPYEALKAQAVAAYTYAMYHGDFGAGQTIDYNFNYEGTNVERAVMSVLNITSAEQQPHCNYVSYNNRYANTVYYSNCAGTATSSVNAWGGSKVPYLCGGMSSPEEVDITTYEIEASEMKKLIQSYANSNGLSVDFSGNPATWLNIVNHDGAYNKAVGYIGTIEVCGNPISGNEFRSRVMGGKLRSHCFTIQYVTE